MKFLIYELFSGVGFYNQLFSLETAIYLANICNRKLILFIKCPLCHCGRASWDYGNFLDYFNDDYKEFLTNGIEVYYRQPPEKWKNIIKSKSCKTLNFKCKLSNLIMVDPELNIDSNKKNINLFCNGRQSININLKEIDDTYIYTNKSNASRCFYNFYTTKNNYYLMSKICNSLKNLNTKINKYILNINNFDLAIHLRLGDGHKSKSTIDAKFNSFSQSLLKKISILDNVENILLMSDRKDAEIIDILKTKYKNISFTEDLIKDIKFDNVTTIKNIDVVKFLIQKSLCENSNHFIGMEGSTVSNYIQYKRFINDKDCNMYLKRNMITGTNNYTWNQNNVGGHPISWSYFWSDNIYAIKYPEYRKGKYYIKIIKEINISPKKNKKIISYCLYGLNNDRNRKRYFDKGVYVNYHYMKNHNYKDWIMRVYIPYDEPDDIINNIRQFKDIEIILVDTNICLRSLRFLPNDDPNVKVWLSRDLDSIVNNREEKAVEDWLENRNDKKLMIMSDNRQHTWTIAGGMFGYKNDFKKNISQYIVEYEFEHNNPNCFANDCILAENFFYTNNNYIQYYRSGKKLANSIPFPDLSSIHCGFVGNISPIDRYYINLKCEEIYPFLSKKSVLQNNDKFLYSPWNCFFKDKETISTLIWNNDDFCVTVDPKRQMGSGTFKTINGDGKKILKLDTHIKIFWEDKKYLDAYMPNKETISVKHGNTWYNFIKYINKNCLNLPKLNRNIFMVWTGDNIMGTNRKRCYENFKKQCGVNVILVTKDNLNKYILPEHPIHPAYEFLSYVHRSDYLRCYLMYNYGGGYSDIKETTKDWNLYFDKLEHSNDKDICGYQEGSGWAAASAYAFAKKMGHTQPADQVLVGCGNFICKPKTIITSLWYEKVNKFLDSKLEQLKLNPADNSIRPTFGIKYPIKWNHLMGNIFHEICYIHHTRLLRCLPMCVYSNYRDPILENNNLIDKVVIDNKENTMQSLIEKYNDFYKKNNFNIKPTVWNPTKSYINTSFTDDFRRHNAYVWQININFGELYNITKKSDIFSLLDKTKENGSHGCKSLKFDNTIVSRDLLDSVMEITYLKTKLPNIENMNIIEIGGGYGRLCKRFLDCFPNSNYYVTDGIPQSTYFSKKYLKEKEDHVVNLFDIENKLSEMQFDIAFNIHSFPECNINDIEWWIKLIHDKKIKYVFFVPNNPTSTDTFLPTNKKESILNVFTKYNYEVIDFTNVYKKHNTKYPYAVPFFILENNK